MKRLSFYVLAGLISSLALLTTSCKDDEATPAQIQPVDPSVPSGTTTIGSMAFTAQSGKPTTGTASLISDANGDYFVAFDSDFNTDLGTGTVSVFLTKNLTTLSTTDPSVQQVIGIVSGAGATYYKLSGQPDASFTHVVLWCGTVGVPFGNARIQ